MQTRWSDRQKELRDDFAALGATIAPAVAGARNRRELDPKSWSAVADAGLFGLPISAAHGGRGGSWWDFVAALEGLATTTGDLGILLSMIAQMGAARIIQLAGSDEQKRAYLPRAIGGSVCATATTEPTGGSDVARIATAAVYDGDTIRLTGRKAHITNAPIAEIFIVLGRIPELGEKRDITLFLFDRRASGLSTGDAELMLGNPTSPTGDIFMQDLALSSVNVVGQAGDGLTLLHQMLAFDRTLYAVVAAGFLEPMIKASLTYARQRSSFTRRLADHQYVQDKIVLMKVAMEQSRLLAHGAMDRLLNQDTEAMMMGSIAKLVSTEALWKAAQEMMQLHGHLGYMQGSISDVFCDTVATRIAGGTSELQKVNIFKQLERLSSRGAVASPQPEAAE